MAAEPHRSVPTVVLALIVPLIVVVGTIVTLNVTSDNSGGASASSGGGGGTAAAGSAIVIKNFAFSPAPLKVKSGTTITVTNDDGTAHSLTADNKRFDTHDLGTGDKATITVGAPGKYSYHCDIHNYMTGVIEVS
jgi:plastocyanin